MSLSDAARLACLSVQDILDTEPEQGFDDIVRLASRLCAAPIALVSLVTADRQWFKARVNFAQSETDLSRSVCQFTLDAPDVLVIPDLSADPRTADNPLVTQEPHIRFYAGAPLRTAEGHTLGSLCVIDVDPRPDGLSAEQAEDLRALARQVMARLDLRRATASEQRAQAAAVADARRLEAMIVAQQRVASPSADLDTVFGAIVDGALHVVDNAAGAVVELRDGEDLVYRAVAGTSNEHIGTRVPLYGTVSGRALLEATSLYCADTFDNTEANHELARRLGIRSMIAVPIFRHGVAIGVLKAQSGEAAAFSARDMLMMQVLGGLVASGLSKVAERETGQALRDAESRYKAIFDSATDVAIVAADARACITDWNIGAERIMGWKADEVRGEPLDAVVTPEDRITYVAEQDEATARLIGSAPVERWHLKKDGQRFWATGRMMTLRHEDGGIRGYLNILQDGTRERRREQRLGLIASASEALLATDDPSDALIPILTEGTDALGFAQSFTWEFDANGSKLCLTQAIGIDETTRTALRHVGVDGPLCGIVAETGQPLILSHLQDDPTPRYAAARAAGLNGYAGYPITGHAGLAGIISFTTHEAPGFDPEALAFFATIARFLSLAHERRDSAAALRASEERLRDAQEAGRIGTFDLDMATDLLTVSPEFCRIFGLAVEPTHPVTAVEALVLADGDASSSAATRRAGSADLDVEYRIRRIADGALRWVNRRAQFVRGSDGAVTRMFGMVHDISDRRRLQAQQAALIALGDHLRGATTATEVAEVVAKVLGHTLSSTRAGFAQIEMKTGRFVIERDWTAEGVASLAGAHDLSRFQATIDRVVDGDTLTVADVLSVRALADDAPGYAALGTRAAINVPVLEDGGLIGLVYAHQNTPRPWTPDEDAFVRGVADRTSAALAKVQAEAGQQLLNEELSHRLKNTLAMVQAIASQTLRRVTERGPVEAFEHRLQALATAHDVLLQRSYKGASMHGIIGQVLHGTGQPDRFDIHGPDLELNARAALALALLLHELATNAAKYGALSNDVGRVSLSWSIAPGEEPELVMRWVERGGPPVQAPERRGFGSRIIGLGLIGTGGVDLNYSIEGFEASMRAPLARMR